MLTDRGWAGTGVAAALAVLWVLLGEIELLGAAVIIAGVLLAALAITRFGRPEVSVVRRLAPGLVHEGDRAAVDAVITNRGRRTLTNVSLVDEVGSLGRAVFQAGVIRPGESGDAQYQILCRPRGVYPVGPVTATVTDPLRLAQASSVVPTLDRLIVYPEVEDLVGFPMTRGRDPAMQASRPEFSQRGGEDFYTLREYVFGDDLRRVHWPSSAKKDDLMIRQLETPWQSRALVILDLRWKAYESEDCFEKAVRGAACIVRHLAREGFDADLWAGGSTSTPIEQYGAVMEKLAVVEREGRLDIRAVATRLKSVGRGGALIVVTGVPDSDILEVQRLMSREYRTTVVMSAAETASSGEIALQRAGAITVSVSPSQSWAMAWARVMGKTWSTASSG